MKESLNILFGLKAFLIDVNFLKNLSVYEFESDSKIYYKKTIDNFVSLKFSNTLHFGIILSKKNDSSELMVILSENISQLVF